MGSCLGSSAKLTLDNNGLSLNFSAVECKDNLLSLVANRHKYNSNDQARIKQLTELYVMSQMAVSTNPSALV